MQRKRQQTLILLINKRWSSWNLRNV